MSTTIESQPRPNWTILPRAGCKGVEARIGDATFEIRQGQNVRWPRDVQHCLWTTDDTMETIMVERHARQDR